MVTSILNDILGLEKRDTDSIQEYLIEHNITIFDTIFASYKEEEPYYIIMAILFMYSTESPFLIVHSDHAKEKHNVCRRLDMPEYIEDFITSMDAPIRHAIVDYLEYFAGAEWRMLQFLKIQLDDIQEIITRKKSTDKDGAFSIKEHMACVREAKRLAADIDKMEKDIKVRDKHLFIDNILGEKKDINRKVSVKGGGVEASKQIS